MTREDIISAAFEVWGKDLYRTNSLSDIAMRLGVTKPAIYRHFAGKDALKEAMYEVFFDKAAEFLRGHWEKLRALSAAGKKREFYRTFALMMDAIHEHERCYFMYFFFEIYGRASAAARQGKTIFRPIDEFRKRGLDFADFDGMAFDNDREPPGYPRTMQMVLLMETFYAATVFFMMKDHIEGGGRRETLDRIVTEKINTGLGFPVSELHNMDFAALDSLLVFEAAPSNPLLDAVGRAVAEAGPWGASMEMVARFAGLSKSGLYSHFASRGEMMGELFRSELDAIDRTVKKTVPAGRNAGESFYLSLAAVAGYLLSKPAILDAFDWLKARQPWSPRRRLERHCVPADAPGVRVLNGLFSQVTRPDKSPYLNDIDTYFVVFMIVNILARRPVKSGADAEPRRFCVPMFKFLAAGLQGLEE